MAQKKTKAAATANPFDITAEQFKEKVVKHLHSTLASTEEKASKQVWWKATCAAIGGLKVVTENGWFAARPSGTEAIYKIYMESFKDEAHLAQIQKEAQEIVSAALAKAGV